MDLQSLRDVDLFAGLDAVQLAHLTSIAAKREVSKGTILFDEGDKADAFYVIMSGRVRISKVVSGIGEEALAVLSPGSYFGEMELIDRDVPRAARAVVHEDCILQVIQISDFHTLLSTDRELALAIVWGMVKTLSRRLRATNDRVTAMFAMAQFG